MTAREYLKQSFYINKEIDENILQQEELGHEELSSVHKVHRKSLVEFIKIHGNNF